MSERDFYYLDCMSAEELSHHMGNALMIIGAQIRRAGLDLDLKPIEAQLEAVRDGVVDPAALVIEANKLASACTIDPLCYEQATRISNAIHMTMLPPDAPTRPQLNESGELL